MTNPVTRRAIRVGEVPSSNLGAPIVLENREQPRTRANIPENAGHRGSVFARVRGCSLVWRPQTDRRESEKGPQEDRSRPRADERQSRLWAKVLRLSWCAGRGMP